MTDINAPFTAVQISLRSRMWLLNLVWILAILLMLLGLAALISAGVALTRFSGKSTPAYAADAAHFMYASIGAEPNSGLPYWERPRTASVSTPARAATAPRATPMEPICRTARSRIS